MPKNLNRATFVGTAGSDMEMRYTPSGFAIGRVNIAVADDYFDKKTEKWVDRTYWIPLTFLGEYAERSEQRVKKGTKLVVECTVKNNDYKNKDGVEVKTFSFDVSSCEVVKPAQTKEAKAASDEPSESADDVKAEVYDNDPPF